MTKHEQVRIALLFAAVILLLAGCARSGQIMDGEDMFRPAAYTQISQEEAGERMGRDDGTSLSTCGGRTSMMPATFPGPSSSPMRALAPSRRRSFRIRIRSF